MCGPKWKADNCDLCSKSAKKMEKMEIIKWQIKMTHKIKVH